MHKNLTLYCEGGSYANYYYYGGLIVIHYFLEGDEFKVIDNRQFLIDIGFSTDINEVNADCTGFGAHE